MFFQWLNNELRTARFVRYSRCLHVGSISVGLRVSKSTSHSPDECAKTELFRLKQAVPRFSDDLANLPAIPAIEVELIHLARKLRFAKAHTDEKRSFRNGQLLEF